MECCIQDIRNWMVHDRLMINDAKCEFLIIGTWWQLQNTNISNVTMGDSVNLSFACVRNVGPWFHSEITMTPISPRLAVQHFHLHNIRLISKFLSHYSLSVFMRIFYDFGIVMEKDFQPVQKTQNKSNPLIGPITQF